MGKEIHRESEVKGETDKQAEFGHDCALGSSRLGPSLQQGTLILTPRGSMSSGEDLQLRN